MLFTKFYSLNFYVFLNQVKSGKGFPTIFGENGTFLYAAVVLILIISFLFFILGAIDGKHIQLKAPSHSSALYYNYKGYFSSVLLAVSDANYRFVYASFGSYGHESDGGIFDRCELSKIINDGSIGLRIFGS